MNSYMISGGGGLKLRVDETGNPDGRALFFIFPTLRKPVPITHGEKDEVAVLGLAKYNAAKIAHARTSYYPNIGHAPFWEDAERFNRELREFAAGLV